MTPSTIFQWPLSPSGSFQPVKSFPLNSETKPDPDADVDGASDAQDTRPARNSPSVKRFMIILPPGSRCPRHPFRPATAFGSLFYTRFPDMFRASGSLRFGRLEEGIDEDDDAGRPGVRGGLLGRPADPRGQLF